MLRPLKNLPFFLSLPLNLYSITALKHSIFLPPKLLITPWILSAVHHGSLWMVLPPSVKSFPILIFPHQSYVSISIFHDSENPLVDLFPTEMHRCVHKETNRRLSTATVFVTTTNWKQPKWLETVERIINVWYIYSNKNEQTTTTATCNNMTRSHKHNTRPSTQT